MGTTHIFLKPQNLMLNNDQAKSWSGASNHFSLDRNITKLFFLIKNEKKNFYKTGGICLLLGLRRAQYCRIFSMSEDSCDNRSLRYCSFRVSFGSVQVSPHVTNTIWSRFKDCKVKSSLPFSSNSRLAANGRFKRLVQESRNCKFPDNTPEINHPLCL